MNLIARMRELERQLAAASKAVSNLRKDLKSGVRPRLSTASNESLIAYLALSPSLADDLILQNLLRCAMSCVSGGGAGLTLLDARKKRLVFRAALGDGSDGLIGQQVPLKGSRHGLAFATGEVQSATPIYSKVEKKAAAKFRNVLVAPLMVNGEAIGTMSAVNKEGASHFNAEDIAAFKLFADVAALVVRQRSREQILRKGLSHGRHGANPSQSAFSDEDRELLDIFETLARIKNSRPGLLSVMHRLIKGMDVSA